MFRCFHVSLEWIHSYDPKTGAILSMFYLLSTKRVKDHIRWRYNAHAPSAMLLDAGFSGTAQCRMSEGKCLDVERINDRTDSISFEATKTK